MILLSSPDSYARNRKDKIFMTERRKAEAAKRKKETLIILPDVFFFARSPRSLFTRLGRR
jgi:hypothetical protein